MLRVRGAGPVALPLALILVFLATSLTAAAATRRSDAAAAVAGPAIEAMAAVAWPVSSLVVSEVQTGGASASDEFAELYNGGPLAADLMGLELVYSTSTGSTVTRKATWTTSFILEPGRHLLIANAAGIYAAQADATYSGGFAATGGAVVLRVVGANPVDAVAWGDATNSFVEGTPAPAPAAGSSVERLPGGSLGNGTDTNSNLSDFFAAVPSPQNLAAGPVPAPGPSSSPAPTPTPTATPTPTPLPTPTTTPAPSLSPTPVPTPTATSTPVPTPTPTAVPTPTPTPTPSPTATPTPIPTPAPTVISSIAEAKSAADGSTVAIAGTLTTPLGAMDSSRIGFVQDETGGIALRLDAALPTPLAAGVTVTATGSLGSYFSLRTLNVTSTTIVVTGAADLPTPLALTTGALGEAVEGLRIEVSGTVTEAPAPLADGIGITIDDGSGPIRIVAAPAAQAGATIATGDSIMAIGPLGQRDSSGSGAAGYRVHATGAGELIVLVAPSPTPTPSPSPTPSPTATPSPTPLPTPSPTPTPTSPPSPSPTPIPTPGATPSPTPPPSATPIAISAARALPLGSRVTVGGVVTAEAGRLGTPPLLAIQDDSAAIVVRLPDALASPRRGSWIEIEGALAAPYGQLEVRSLSRLGVVGAAAMPAPIPVDGSSLGEAVEARLVTLTGTVKARPTKASSGDITFVVDTGLGLVRLSADAAAGIAPATINADERLRLTGVAGQRASRKGALDGYRVWLRDAADVVQVAGPVPSGSPSPSPTSAHSSSQSLSTARPGAASSSSGTTISIAAAIRARTGAVKVDGTVIAGATLLDATGRRIVVADRSAAIEILLAAGSTAPRVGSRVRVAGEIGRAYGAPRIRATQVTVTPGGSLVSPLELRVAPGTAHEWRLVRVRGDVVDVHKLGDRWRAELLVGGQRIPISGLAGARIPSTTLTEGQTATIVGIVRRPYPSAMDRRFAIVPRGPSDVSIGGAADDRSTRSSGPSGSSGHGPDAGAGGPGSTTGTRGATTAAQPIDVDLAEVRDHVGALVRVGGLVGDIGSDGFALDDGTAIGHVVLRGAGLDQLPLIETGDALNAIGVVEASPDPTDPAAFVVAVTDPAGIVRVGDPIGDAPSATPSDGPSSGASPAGADDAATHRAGGLLDAGLQDLGIAGIVLAGFASLAATLLRRHRMRRQLAARVAQRLNGLVASPPRKGG